MDGSNLVIGIDKPVDVVAAVKRALSKLPKRPAVNKLVDVSLHSHETIYRARAVFPFDLFPDIIIIDKEKLTIISNFFFWEKRITSVPIRDILNVEVDCGPFFGCIKLASRYFFTNPRSIGFLWRRDALRIQKLLQGFIIANERGIDCSSINKEELETLLEHLGETNEKPSKLTRPIL